MPLQRLKVAIPPLDLPCSGPVTHSGEVLTNGKSHGKKPDRFSLNDNMDVEKVSRFKCATWNIGGVGEKEEELDNILNENDIKVSVIRLNQSIHWHVQNAMIPCRSQEPLPFLPVIHFFLPLLSSNHPSIIPHFIQPSISWSTSWSCCFQIHTQYSFGNPIFFHSLYMSKPT